jgi:hypothetical protein
MAAHLRSGRKLLAALAKIGEIKWQKPNCDRTFEAKTLMAGRCFYVSWIDKSTDPWPQWEKIRPGADETLADGRVIRCLPVNHTLWPGVPLLDQGQAPVVADPRMGRYVWPGIPLVMDGRPCRLYTGPTLSALFHPGSRFCNLLDLDGVYLLYQPERKDVPREALGNVLTHICKARDIKNADKRIKFVEIKGIADVTDHSAIIREIEKWLAHADPFDLGRRHAAKQQTRVVVNLSPGTPAMHAAWLMLRWNGALGGAETVIEFVQGDGGLSEQPSADGPPPNPLRNVPIDVLSQFVARPGQTPQPVPGPDEPGVPLEEMTGAPFDDLRQRIDHAAMLGLPILLQGERGTGKTFLAHYYHRRRQLYRAQAGAVAQVKGPAARDKSASGGKTGERFPEKTGDGNFVGVTLSEFADIETLRDTLFGWAKGSWTGADKGFDGLLGEAHGGTLFLDEVHHLARPLQASLLAPLNSRRYRPKMATYEIVSYFDLVVATNDQQWREKMADDFRDRIERIVLEVPAFRSFQRHNSTIIWRLWDFTLRRRCRECNIEYAEDSAGWPECREQLRGLFQRHPLAGNWRDLQRLADNLLLHLTSSRDGRPSPIRWDRDKLENAIAETFAEKK